MKKEYKILIIIGLVYICLLLMFISKFNFNPSATIELSENYFNIYGGKIPSGIIVHESNGFDGQYYYAMSLNPTLEKTHLPTNFLQRITYPLLARILSLNIISFLPVVFILINLASILTSCFVLMRLLKKYNASLNLVFLWAFNVGFLISITRNLTEPLMLCFISLMVYFFEENKHYFSAIFLALAILTRELALPIYAALLLYFLIKKDAKNFFIYALAIAPFAIWEILLMQKMGTLPLILSSYAISKTPTGFWGYFKGLAQAQPSSLQNANAMFSPLPVILFAILQFFIMIFYFIKDRKITKYTLLLLSQIALLAMLQKSLFFEEIDAVGRYALPMFFFSILYFAERGKKYNKILAGLMILSSALYFVQRFIFPKGKFWTTF